MEVYGEKPKLFSAKWWTNYWYYYKWHTVIGIFLAVTVGISISQCASNPKYDLQVDLVTDAGVTEEMQDKLTEFVASQVDDADGNEKNEAFVLYLDMRDTVDIQVKQAMQTKLFLEQGYSESFLFIMKKQYFDWLASAEIFEPAESWAGDKAEEEYGVKIDGTPILSDLGIDTTDTYVAVRKLRDDEKSEYAAKQHDNAIKLAKYLINQE